METKSIYCSDYRQCSRWHKFLCKTLCPCASLTTHCSRTHKHTHTLSHAHTKAICIENILVVVCVLFCVCIGCVIIASHKQQQQHQHQKIRNATNSSESLFCLNDGNTMENGNFRKRKSGNSKIPCRSPVSLRMCS